MALGALPQVLQLQFFLQDRQLDVVHQGGTDAITQRLESLNLGAVLQSSAPFQADPTASADNSKADADERKLLLRLLTINAVMFVTELIVGVWAQSTGLIADSLDMLADAAVGAGDQGNLAGQSPGTDIALLAAIGIGLHFALRTGNGLGLCGEGWFWIVGHRGSPRFQGRYGWLTRCVCREFDRIYAEDFA